MTMNSAAELRVLAAKIDALGPDAQSITLNTVHWLDHMDCFMNVQDDAENIGCVCVSSAYQDVYLTIHYAPRHAKALLDALEKIEWDDTDLEDMVTVPEDYRLLDRLADENKQ